MASLVSSLFVKLTANTTGFQSNMQKAERRVQSTAKQMEKATRSIKQLAGAFGVGIGVAMFTRMANSAIQAGSAITDMAIATRTGIEEIQALNYAAREAGASNEQMANLLIRVQKSASDAGRGLSTARDAFAKLNIDTEKFLQLRPEQMLEELGKALVKAGDDTRAYGAALDILGTRNAPKLMEVMQRLGTEGFSALSRAARDAGQVMDKDVAQRLDKAADSVVNFQNAVTIHVGEAIAFWAELGDQIAAVNKELRANSASSGGGIMASYMPKVEGVENAEQRLALLKELQGKLMDASRALLEGERDARTGAGYFDQSMRNELTASITSFQLLIRKLGELELPDPSSLVTAVTTAPQNDADAFLATMATIEQGMTGIQMAAADATATTLSFANLSGPLKELAFEGFGSVKAAVGDARDSVAQWHLDIASGVTSVAGAIEDGLINAARNGKAAFGDMAEFILAEIQRIFIRSLILRPLFGAIGSAFGGSGTVLGSAFGEAFGGGKAAGGPVSEGVTYRVGEHGPETLHMGSNGYVSPAGSGRGSVYQIDARGADPQGIAHLEGLIRQLNGSIEHRAVAAVANQHARRPNYLRR